MNRLQVVTLLLLLVGQVAALEEEKISFEGIGFRVVWVDPREHSLRIVWKDSEGNGYHNLRGVQKRFTAKGKQLRFITNAGIYETVPGKPFHYQPEGLHIEDGKLLRPLNQRDGKGNFYLKPNGVFFVDAKGQAQVLTTPAYAKAKPSPRLACQSGPMLVINGAIHAAINPEGKSKRLRNGVGVNAEGLIAFAVTESGEASKLSHLRPSVSRSPEVPECALSRWRHLQDGHKSRQETRRSKRHLRSHVCRH